MARKQSRRALMPTVTLDDRDPSACGWAEHLTELPGGTAGVVRLRPSDEIRLALDRALVRFAPAHVLVDTNLQVVELHGNAGRYLELASGNASLDLFGMLRDGLAGPLKAILRLATRRSKPVRKRNVAVETNAGTERIDLEVVPMTAGSKDTWFLVVFTIASHGSREVDDMRALVDRLRKELASVREALRAAVEQQELTNRELNTANEDVQSANEELQSINEELETSREQLQSSNDELLTVNEGLLRRGIELATINSELNSVLHSLQIAIVIVDTNLRIKRFTTEAQHLLNLIPTDIGRPLGDLNLWTNARALHTDLEEVVATGISKTFAARGHNGHEYSLRLHPYLTVENRIEGAAIVSTQT